jgi:beta-phosphoglucomutase
VQSLITPHASIFPDKAAEKLKLPNRLCLVAEDAAAGIQAAKAAEMKTLAVGKDHRLLGADWNAPTLAEVADWDVILK